MLDRVRHGVDSPKAFCFCPIPSAPQKFLAPAFSAGVCAIGGHDIYFVLTDSSFSCGSTMPYHDISMISLFHVAYSPLCLHLFLDLHSLPLLFYIPHYNNVRFPMNDFFTGVLPWLLWVGRIALSAVAVLLLIRCGRALLSGGKQESWGFLSLSNGARYPLYHWENMIGRARQADIRINFPSVSRSHAALCRDSWNTNPVHILR